MCKPPPMSVNEWHLHVPKKESLWVVGEGAMAIVWQVHRGEGVEHEALS